MTFGISTNLDNAVQRTNRWRVSGCLQAPLSALEPEESLNERYKAIEDRLAVSVEGLGGVYL